MSRPVPKLTLVPPARRTLAELQANLMQESVLDLSRRLRDAGWQVNIAFESGDDGERFTLSGVHA